MELQPVLENARNLIRQGETGKALEVLTDFLGNYRNEYRAVLRTLDVISADYNSVRQKGLKGILTNQEIEYENNKTNDSLLTLIDALADGKLPQMERTRRYSRRIWWIGGAVLLLGGLAAALLLDRRPGDCRDWDKNKVRVFILPFSNLTETTAQPTIQLKTAILELTQKNQLPVQVRLASKLRSADIDLDVARKAGKRCAADLVLWGTYKASGNDSIRVRIGYSFTGDNDKSSLGAFRTFSDVTQVGPDRDLQDAIFSVCAMLALRGDKPGLAMKWLLKIKEPNGEESRMLKQLEKRLN